MRMSERNKCKINDIVQKDGKYGNGLFIYQMPLIITENFTISKGGFSVSKSQDFHLKGD